MALTKPPVLPVWADTGDKTQPTDAEIQAGWPVSNIPPTRQRFNWFFNFVANGIRYLTRRGMPDYAADETYMTGDRVNGPDGKTYVSKIDNNLGHTPAASPAQWERWGQTASELDAAITEAVSAVGGYYQDTGSVANAYVIAPIPALSGSYQTGDSFRVRTTRTNTGGCTLDAGLGAKPLLLEDGTAAVGGDIFGIITVTYDASVGGGSWLLNGDAISQYGDLAKLDAGQGIEADGAGGARVKLADNSMRRTAAGIQSNEPVAYFSGARAITSADHMTTLVATATGSVTAPQTTTLWNGFAFTIDAQGGNVTLTPNAADTVNGGTPGAAYIVPNGTSAQFVGDGAGNITALYQTAIPGASPAPQYINSTQSITSGQYIVDSSAGPISLTIPASPTLGTSIRLIDALNTWWQNPVTLIPGGGNTVMGNSGNFILDVQGADILIIYKSTDWSIQ